VWSRALHAPCPVDEASDLADDPAINAANGDFELHVHGPVHRSPWLFSFLHQGSRASHEDRMSTAAGGVKDS
jgi:hypothetical protein